MSRALERIGDRVRAVLGLGAVTASNSAGAVQSLQIKLSALETHDDLSDVSHYGFTSNPLPTAQGIVLFVGGDRSNGLVIGTSDSTNRKKGLVPGEVALYTDLGQTIYLARQGVTMDGASTSVTVTAATLALSSSGPLSVTAPGSIALDAPTVATSGGISATGVIEAAGGLALGGALLSAIGSGLTVGQNGELSANPVVGALSPATANALGGVMVPTTISTGFGTLHIDGSGHLTIPIAAVGTLGVVQPDNVTVTVNAGGTLSAIAGGTVSIEAGTGLTLTAGTLDAQWSAGTVTAFGGGLVLSGTTLTAPTVPPQQWTAGDITGVTGNISIVGTDLVVPAPPAQQWVAGDVLGLGTNLAIVSGTLEISGLSALSGAIPGTGLALSGNDLNAQWSAGAVGTLGANLGLTGGTLAVTGVLEAANDLSDLANASAARGNLGLNGIASQAAPAAGLVISNGTILAGATLTGGLALAGDTLTAPVSSVAGRTGAITLGVADVAGLNGIASQAAPAAGLVVSNGTILAGATLAGGLVLAADTLTAPVSSVAGRTGAITLGVADVSGALAAANDLSDLASVPAARGNLGLNGIASQAAPAAGLVISNGTILAGATLAGGLALAGDTLTAPVSSVAGRTGAITLGVADVVGLNGIASQAAPVAGMVASTGTILAPVTLAGGLVLSADTLSAPVSSVAGRTGAVALTTADISGLGSMAEQSVPGSAALLVSTGSAVQAATLAGGLVLNANTLTAPVSSVAGRTGAITLGAADVAGLNAIASQAAPAAGLVLSTGTLLSAGTIGAGLTLSGGTLAASGTLAAEYIGGQTLADIAAATVTPWRAGMLDGNDDRLQLVYTRSATPNGQWSSVRRLLQHVVDVSDFGYIEWSPAANSGGIDLGAGNTPGLRVTPSGSVELLQGATVSIGLQVSGPLVATSFSGAGSGITGVLQSANNLSDLASAATARGNLGLNAIASQAVPAAGLVASTGALLAAATLGAGLTFSGATLAARLPFFDPRDYGAKFDGVTDDTAANTSCLNAAGTAGGGTVFLPLGTTIISAALPMPANVLVQGAGPGTVIAPSTAGQDTFAATESAETVLQFTVRDLCIRPAAANCNGVVTTLACFVLVERVVFEGCLANVQADRGYVHQCIGCKSLPGPNGDAGQLIYTDTTNADFCKHVTVLDYTPAALWPATNPWGGAHSPSILFNRVAIGYVMLAKAYWMATPVAGINDLIHLAGNCQGITIADLVAEGVANGIVLQQGADGQLPSYVQVARAAIDVFSQAAVAIYGVSGAAAKAVQIADSILTEPCTTVASATPAAGGASFAVGDTLTLPAPAAQVGGVAAVLTVSSVSAGAVTGVTVANMGLYSPALTNPVSPASTSGSGTGASFNLTWNPAGTAIIATELADGEIRGNYIENYSGSKVGGGLQITALTGSSVHHNKFRGLASAIDVVGTLSNAVELADNDIDPTIPTAISGVLSGQFLDIRNNRGINPLQVPTPAVPASGAQWVNNTGARITAYVEGGTVQSVYVNAVLTGAVAGGFTLGNGESILINYTSAPSWTLVGW